MQESSFPLCGKGLQQSPEDAQSTLEQPSQGVSLKIIVYLENIEYINHVLCQERPIMKSDVTVEYGLTLQMPGSLPFWGLFIDGVDATHAHSLWISNLPNTILWY